MKLGLPDGCSEPDHVDRAPLVRPATEGFGPGFNGTLTVVVDAPEVARDEQEAFGKQVADELEDFPGVAAVSPAGAEQGGRPLDRPGHARDRPGLGRDARPRHAMRDKADELPTAAGITAYVTGTDRDQHRHRRPPERGAAALHRWSSSASRCCC